MFIRKVIQSLNHYNVRYALIGGYAVALHGVVRGTVDIDIIIGLNQVAYENAEAALMAIGLKPRLPLTSAELFQFRQEYIDQRNLKAWSFVNFSNPLEVVDILIIEDLDTVDTVIKRALGLNITVVTIDALIRMKKRSGRPQDIEDIRALERLR